MTEVCTKLMPDVQVVQLRQSTMRPAVASDRNPRADVLYQFQHA